MHSETDIGAILRGHFQLMDRVRRQYSAMRAAAANDLWGQRGNGSAFAALLPGSERDDGLDRELRVKAQVNTLRPWLNRSKASLYQHQPRVTVAAPAIRSKKLGRLKAEKGDAIGAALTRLVRSKRWRDATEDAMEQGLLMPGVGLKVGIDKSRKGNPLNRVWFDVVQRWDVVLDDRVTCADQARFIGHLRWARLSEAREVCIDLPENHGTTPIGEWLVNGPDSVADVERANGYVQLLEWWDLEANEVQTFVVASGGQSVQAFGSEPGPVPYQWPDGSPLVQVMFHVFESEVGYPLRGVPMALPYLYESAEKSLIVSIIMNKFRRDARRPGLARKVDGFSDADLRKFQAAVDGEVVTLDVGPDVDLARLVYYPEPPDTSKSVDAAYQYLSALASESSSLSSIGRGQTGDAKYMTSGTAMALGQGDAAAASMPASRMSAFLSDVLRAIVAMLGQESQGFVSDHGLASVKVSPDDLRAEWDVVLEDVGAETQKKAQKKVEAIQVLPMWTSAVVQATTASGPPGPDGAPMEIPDAVRVAGQRTVDLIVELFELPESMRWNALIKAEPDIDEEVKETAEEFMPEEEPPPELPVEEPLPEEPLPEEMPPEAPPVDAAALNDPRAAVLAQLPPEALAAIEAYLNGGQ